MIKLLLLGLGRWGANHLRVLRSLPIELFVADVQSRQLEAARKLGIPETHCSSNPEEMFSKVDAAVIVTPAQTHFDLARQLLSTGKDVFLEKPITLKAAEAGDLTALAAKNQRILQVGHIFRFDPASQWLREAIQQGQFGYVRMMRSSFSGFKRPRNDSGVILADAIHFVDLYNYLLGAVPVSVSAAGRDFLGRGMEDAAMLSLQYETLKGSTWGVVEANYFLPGKFREVVVIGSALTAVCDYNASQYKIKTYQNEHVQKGAEFQSVEGVMRQIESPPEEPLLAELRAFLNSIETRQKPLADGQAGYDSMRVIEAAFESMKTGKTVKIA
jgi:predicted dehydrogenase